MRFRRIAYSGCRASVGARQARCTGLREGESVCSWLLVLLVDSAVERRQNGFVHGLRQGGVREDRASQLGLSGFETASNGETLDLLSDFGADHVGAQQLAGSGIEDRLHQTLTVAEGKRLAVGGQVEAAHADGATGLFRLFLGEANACHLRAAIGAAGN